jgi:hypothetical protein
MKQNPEFPAGININGTEYYDDDELTAYEEARRRERLEHAA